jgi:hypothetical protein
MIEISEAAQGYLRGLLEKQDESGTGIRIFVTQPGSTTALPPGLRSEARRTSPRRWSISRKTAWAGS